MSIIIIKLTDVADDQVRLDVQLDPNNEIEEDAPLTGAMVATMGIRMLFDSGDIWEAGIMAARAINDGDDPIAIAEAAKKIRAAERGLKITEATE